MLLKKSWLILITMLLLGAMLLMGCAAPAEEPAAEPEAEEQAVEEHQPATILIAAAASLENAYVESLIPMFEQQYDWITVEGTYDSSGKLQTQIEEGLAADIFMSAALKQMNALVEGGFVEQAAVIELLENKIVLIEPAAAPSGIDSFEQAADAAIIAIGDPESVPAGQYAQEAFTSLGIWEQVLAKASLGTNVTEVLNWVAEGSADIGVVYATDAASNDGVTVIAEAPAGALAAPVIYPVALLADAPQAEAAQLFIDFLQSDEAAAVFTEYGFTVN
ncbi:MAG: molybdate ABC transporter substrate-binding protein [Bacillota bacterium]|nr:molybdate ABC transporter substrate-binding protein [Bacillota bacterium]